MKHTLRHFRIAAILAAIATGCTGCTFMCYYHETGQLVASANAQNSDASTLADIVEKAIKPLGFSDPRPIHLPGYPGGCPGSRACVPDRDYIDWYHVDPGFFGGRGVVVRIEPTDNHIWITDFDSDATRKESPFVKSVRESIQQQVASVYDQQIDFKPIKPTLKGSMGCPLERGF